MSLQFQGLVFIDINVSQEKINQAIKCHDRIISNKAGLLLALRNADIAVFTQSNHGPNSNAKNQYMIKQYNDGKITIIKQSF